MSTGIIIKTQDEIEKIREAGKRLARVVRTVSDAVRPGITLDELDQIAESMIRDMGDTPAFKGYQPEGAGFPFPSTLCLSVNDEVVHGMASDRILAEGEIISIDCGINHEGVFADHAVTVPVGKVSKNLVKLMNDTRAVMNEAINAARPGNTVGDIGHAAQKLTKKLGNYGIVRELAGHGVGRYIHEDPYIPNYGRKGHGTTLQPGMVIAIEPMLNLGTAEVLLLDDGYTFVTADRSPSAHFEHTVIITEDGPEIATLFSRDLL